MEDFYYCPVCHGKLIGRRNNYFCHECKKQYPIENGVPDFTGRDTYWGIIDRKITKKILECAQIKDWKKALGMILKKESPSFYEYIIRGQISRKNINRQFRWNRGCPFIYSSITPTT